MGRPLFSLSMNSAPAVRVEPEVEGFVVPERWSDKNPFDPDADEFFDDAVFEAFVEPNGFPSPTILDPIPSDPSSIPRPGSPIYTDPPSTATSPAGSPDPAVLISPDAYRRMVTLDAAQNDGDVTLYRTLAGDPSMRSGLSVRRRSATVTTPGPLPPVVPRDAPLQIYLHPQGAPRVAPRPYAWPHAQVLPPASSPPQPSFLGSGNSGPLTNPNARMSLTHIAPTRIRVQDVFTFT
jgi:hypothetical protein